MNDEVLNSIRSQLMEAQSLLIVSHIRPDGDAIGSVLGLGLSLHAVGKSVRMVLADGVPHNFRYLEGYQDIHHTPKGEFDLVVVVDCSDLPRVGSGLGDHSVDINIDHHITNLNFGKTNFVIPNAEATSAILAEAIPQWGLPITPAVANALLTGLVADTLGFRTSNVTPNTLRVAATLMEKGGNLSEVYNRALVHRTFEAARYWGQGLQHLRKENGLVWAVLTLQDRSQAGYSGNDDADLINMLSAIEDSDITLLLVEQKENKVKISWRAQPGFDVSKLALEFGGGGHPAASGAEIRGTISEIQPRVLEKTLEYIKQFGNGKNNRNGDSSPNILPPGDF